MVGIKVEDGYKVDLKKILVWKSIIFSGSVLHLRKLYNDSPINFLLYSNYIPYLSVILLIL